ncbi:Fc.00g020570.m01.CDS01 [Cosmosporella sp. VM-42]
MTGSKTNNKYKSQKTFDSSSTGPFSCQGKPQEEEAGPLLFYMPNAKYGEFCRWYPSNFSVRKRRISELVSHITDEPDLEGEIWFCCAEQFMMYCKAARSYDTDGQAHVLATDSLKKEKRLGKLTVGFGVESWDEVKSKVVEWGSIAKFGQNVHLKWKLPATGDRLLCEAASRHRVWGLGTRRSMPCHIRITRERIGLGSH